MTRQGKPSSIATRLVATLVLFGVSLTVVTLLGAQLVRVTVDSDRERRMLVVRGAQEIMALTGSAEEEAFSYVLVAEPSEKRQSIEKLAAAQDRAVSLASQPDISPARRLALTRVSDALEGQRSAAEAMFAAFESTRQVPRDRYEALEASIDESSEAIRSLDDILIEDEQRAAASLRGRYLASTAIVGLIAVALAIAIGRMLGRRIARPLLDLQKAVTAYGEGRPGSVPEAIANDEVGQLAGAFQRMTVERGRLDDELRQAHKVEAIGQVAGGIAHDFNNVLAAVLSCTEVALEDLGADHPVASDLRDVADAARRGAAMTRQLLDFSRRRESMPRLVSVNDVVTSIRPMLARLAGKQIRMEVSLAASVPMVRMDPTHLDQILMNLVVNARDAMPEGGKLTVETRASGRHTVLSVADTGIGMAPAIAARIFEPLFTTKGPGKGTGLGLATVARVVREAGGTVGVESQLGKGTVFEITLPLSSDASTPCPPRPESKRPSRAPEVYALVM